MLDHGKLQQVGEGIPVIQLLLKGLLHLLIQPDGHGPADVGAMSGEGSKNLIR